MTFKVVDHIAIVINDTDAALAFYRGARLEITGTSGTVGHKDSDPAPDASRTART